MDHKRMLEIIKILSNSDKPINAGSICKTLNVTPRTLRNDIRESKDELAQNGMEILSKHVVGYWLVIHDETLYYQYLHRTMKEASHNQLLVPVYPEDRINYLIRLFLTEDDFLKTEDLSDKLFVSHSTLSNDLKEVRARLKYFQLDLESKPGYGLRITGSELHRRSAIAQYLFHTESDDIKTIHSMNTNHEQEQISAILYQTITEENFHLTDAGFQGLVIHLMITLMRLKEDAVSVPSQYFHTIQSSKEYQIATKLRHRLEESFHVILPEIEVYYIAIHLSSKQAAQYHELKTNYESLLDETLEIIRQKFRIDLMFDMDLRTSLSLHLEPMMKRLKYGMLIQNPLLERIKSENPTAFEMSVILSDVIHKQYGYNMSDTEIGYIALHFALAIQRYNEKGAKKNVIIICASGRGSSQILLYKIRTRFRDNIGSIYTTQLYDLPNIDQSQYDFILTTVPIPFKTDIPAIRVQYFLDQADVIRVGQAFSDHVKNEKMDFVDKYFSDDLFFTNLDGESRMALIHHMCQEIAAVRDIPDSFEDEILKREKFAETEFGNEIAMPHPMNPVTEDTFVAVAVLKRPVRWGRKDVRFIFLLSVSRGSEEKLGMLHESLSALVFDKKALQILEKNPSVITLKQILSELAEKEKNNDLDVLFR